MVGILLEQNQSTMTLATLEKISSDQFMDLIIIKKADALVKFSSASNGAGQILCSTLQSIAPQYSGKVDFFSMDSEKESSLSATYRVENRPTILFFKKGRLVDKLSGLTNRSILSSKINQLINS
jgi:thioredoxin 1